MLTNNFRKRVRDTCFRHLYVDVHAHLTDVKFKGIQHVIHRKCEEANVEKVILNGLEPITNRQVMALCDKYPRYLPALGIYPLDAACGVLTGHWEHAVGLEGVPPPAVFDIEEELGFIEDMAVAGRLVAIGECGLDRHYVHAPTVMAEQERVLRRLMQIALRCDLPLILHSRKAEARVLELLQEEGVERAVFHCFMGKVKLGKRICDAGYLLSIPPAIARSPQHSFRHLVNALPLSSLLTETDSPFMGAQSGKLNDPSQVLVVTRIIAEIKGLSEEEVAAQIRENCRNQFRF